MNMSKSKAKAKAKARQKSPSGFLVDGYDLASREKYERVIAELGPKAKPKEILVAYDKAGGLILDKEGVKIPNGKF